MTTDILTDVSLTDYYADNLTTRECLSSSIAHTMTSRCEKAAWAEHPRYGGKPKVPSEKMELGTLIDELLLAGGRRVQEIPFADYRSNVAKAAKAEAIAAGKIPAKTAKLEQWREKVESVRKQLKFSGVPLTGWSGVCLLWEERATNGASVQCKALLDHLYFEELLIQDLKTGDDCRPSSIPGKMLRLGYALQAAAYTRGLEAICGESAVGRVRFENIWMETSWPHITVRSKPSAKAMMIGTGLWQSAIDKWEACTRTGVWPAYTKPDEVITVDYPEYAEAQLLAELFEEPKTEAESEDEGAEDDQDV